MLYFISENIGPFELFDAPIESSVLTLQDANEQPVPLDGITEVEVHVINPKGDVSDGYVYMTEESHSEGVALYTLISAEIVDDTIVINWLDKLSLFLDSGIYQLKLQLNHAVNIRREFVVEAMDGWHNLHTARSAWPRCPVEDDVQLFELLSIARMQVLEYAEELEDDESVPLNLKTAQLVQARNIWNASLADPTGDSNGEFSFQPRPMDWHVQALIRPRRGFPVVS